MKDIFLSLFGSPAAIAASAVFILAAILIAVFNKKIKERLGNSSSEQMMASFIIFFAVCTVSSIALAIATDGVTWSDTMHRVKDELSVAIPQFSDYIDTARQAANGTFDVVAEDFTPFSLFAAFQLAQFMPANLIKTSSSITYINLLNNQTVILMYLFIVAFCVALIYRMNRQVLRQSGLSVKSEIILFMLMISFPALYCIEMGNIAGLSLVLLMVFICFHESEKRLIRELSLLALGVSAAITPYTLIFSLLLIKKDVQKKKYIVDIAKTFVYFAAFFIIPAFTTGFRNALTYVLNFISIKPDGFAAGNTSIANLLVFFGIDNAVILYMVTIFTEIAAAVCMLILPSVWQKTAAALYIILNIFSVSANQVYIFAFIPLILLLAEKKHRASDWLYLLSYAFLIAPIPTWYYFDSAAFTDFLAAFKLPYIPSANNLFSLAAVQLIFITLCSQMIAGMKQKKIMRNS